MHERQSRYWLRMHVKTWASLFDSCIYLLLVLNLLGGRPYTVFIGKHDGCVCVLWVGVNDKSYKTSSGCSYRYKGYIYFCNRISWRNTIKTTGIYVLFLFFRHKHCNIFVIIAILMRTRPALIFLMFSTDYMKMVPTLLQLLNR